ncbi:MAG: nucleotide-binding protein [Cellvibrio sp.]|uniref:TIR domain-containing protein n=1 Tax=Cellvibrio sp. TaxID=1965322 RepID=UPI002722C170|nr:nucleotide-binding protein [Cellvibrio sp.]
MATAKSSKKVPAHKKAAAATPIPPEKRPYLKQSDVPGASLEEALRIPRAIIDHYAGRPTAPLYVAKALNIDPKGRQLKLLSGASSAFGLIDGGAQASSIAVTELARRVLRPKTEGADLSAKREAVLLPRVFGDFLRNYDGHAFPRQDIAMNVLEDLGVPRDKAEEVLERIDSSARMVGFIEEINGKLYVSLSGTGTAPPKEVEVEPDEELAEAPIVKAAPAALEPERSQLVSQSAHIQSQQSRPTALATAIAEDERRRKVFITHGKSRELVDPIKRLLEFGELVPVVSVERQSVSKPVPEKVMDDMRACGAAIIHVDADRTVVDQDGAEHVLLNPNVLIEIGAAMAFYGRRFILLVREGVKLPSNLQGLYEVRYTNETLDAHATIRLLEAIKDIKNYALPTEGAAGES